MDEDNKQAAEAKEQDPGYGQLIDFSKTKRKKKTTKKKTDKVEEKEKKAKKAKSPDKTGKTLEEGEDGEKERREEITGLLDGEAYEYNFMLERIYKLLQTNHQELIESKKKFIHPPQVMKISGKRTAWINFQKICSMLHRQPDHVLQFVATELNTDAVLGAEQELILKGNFLPKYIETMLKKYILDYVNCKMCKNTNTTLNKDPTTRTYTMHCSACQSTRSVTAIKSGFHALARGERRKARK